MVTDDANLGLGTGFTSPTRGVKKFRTRSRERFLTPKERARLDCFLEAALEKEGGYGSIRFHAVAAIHGRPASV